MPSASCTHLPLNLPYAIFHSCHRLWGTCKNYFRHTRAAFGM